MRLRSLSRVIPTAERRACLSEALVFVAACMLPTSILAAPIAEFPIVASFGFTGANVYTGDNKFGFNSFDKYGVVLKDENVTFDVSLFSSIFPQTSNVISSTVTYTGIFDFGDGGFSSVPGSLSTTLASPTASQTLSAKYVYSQVGEYRPEFTASALNWSLCSTGGICGSLPGVPDLQFKAPADLSVVDFPRIIEGPLKSGPGPVTTGPVTIVTPGGGIYALFTPSYDFTLSDAAAVGGYDHFNWISVITRDTILQRPGDAYWARLSNGQLPTVPYLDAPAGGYYYETCWTGACGVFPGADSRPGYLDEVYTSPILKPGSLLDAGGTYHPANSVEKTWLQQLTSLDDRTLTFFDSPVRSNPGDVVEFLTCLAGLNKDGFGDGYLKDPDDPTKPLQGTCFRWSYVAGKLDFGVINPSNVASSFLSSGDFTVLGYVDSFTPEESSLLSSAGAPPGTSVPAPSTLLLTAVSLAALSGRRLWPLVRAGWLFRVRRLLRT